MALYDYRRPKSSNNQMSWKGVLRNLDMPNLLNREDQCTGYIFKVEMEMPAIFSSVHYHSALTNNAMKIKSAKNKFLPFCLSFLTYTIIIIAIITAADATAIAAILPPDNPFPFLEEFLLPDGRVDDVLECLLETLVV